MTKSNIFIENVMYKILKPVSDDYFIRLQEAENMTAQELYHKIMKSLNLNIIDGEEISEGTTIFPTPGCPHNVRNGEHCGCSFCDWNDTYIANPAYVTVLRKKDHVLYKKMQLECFKLLRGVNKPAHIFEEYAIHDCFNDEQLSDDERDFLFEESNVFSVRPVIGLIQVRAESISRSKIEKWRKMASKQLTLGIGVETGCEWLRNHWLNKKLSDSVLSNAVRIAHDCKCKVSANILMMLPGLNAKQSIELLIDSIIKMDDMGFDSIMLSPLVTKEYTIQNKLKNNVFNMDECIYLIAKAMHELSMLDKRYRNKIMFSSLNFMDYFTGSNFSDNCKQTIEAIKPLLVMGGMKDLRIEKILQFNYMEEYYQFSNRYENLDGLDSIKNTLKTCSQELADEVFSEKEKQEQIELFINELGNWNGANYAKI